MRRWIAEYWQDIVMAALLIGVSVLLLLGCTQDALPPALAEPPVIVEAVLDPSTAQVDMIDCPSPAAERPYRTRKRVGKPAPLAEDLLPAQVSPARPSLPTPDVTLAALSAPAKSAPKRARALAPDALVDQAHTAALLQPTPEGYFGNRAMYRYTYSPGKIYVILTNPETFTKLFFPPGERAATEPTANPDLWKLVSAVVGPPDRRQGVLGVRPKEDGLKMDVSVEMESGKAFFLRFVPSKTPMLAVTWEVMSGGFAEDSFADLIGEKPGSRRTAPACGGAQALQGMQMPVELAQLHTGYKVEPVGKPAFVPVQVFDDGRKTLIKFRPLSGNAPLPYVKRSSGEQGLLQFAPYYVPDDPARHLYYVVENIWPVIELKGSDGASVTITRLEEGIPIAQPWQRY